MKKRSGEEERVLIAEGLGMQSRPRRPFWCICWLGKSCHEDGGERRSCQKEKEFLF